MPPMASWCAANPASLRRAPGRCLKVGDQWWGGYASISRGARLTRNAPEMVDWADLVNGRLPGLTVSGFRSPLLALHQCYDEDQRQQGHDEPRDPPERYQHLQ